MLITPEFRCTHYFEIHEHDVYEFKAFCSLNLNHWPGKDTTFEDHTSQMLMLDLIVRQIILPRAVGLWQAH